MGSCPSRNGRIAGAEEAINTLNSFFLSNEGMFFTSFFDLKIMRIPEELPFDRMDQGCLTTCAYCTEVHPELNGSADCPYCHGQQTKFRPARMMDRQTSLDEVLHSVLNFALEMGQELSQERLQFGLLSLLDMVNLYNFDLKEALIQKIRSLDHKLA
jgi:hypothetical protein